MSSTSLRNEPLPSGTAIAVGAWNKKFHGYKYLLFPREASFCQDESDNHLHLAPGTQNFERMIKSHPAIGIGFAAYWLNGID